MRAKYEGKCARTGRNYPAGTEIVKGASGKWEIDQNAHVADFRRIELAPLAPEFGGAPGADPVTRSMDLNRPIFCSCSKSRPGFNEKDESTYIRFAVQGNALTCPHCGRTGRILPPAPPPPPETKRCWECGAERTYAEVKRAGGEWNENGGCYCGC